MLVNVTLQDDGLDPIYKMISEGMGNTNEITLLETGVYETGHFSFEYLFEEECETWFNLDDSYDNHGVCDNYQQILDKFPVLVESKVKYCICITPIEKKKQSSWGGWRWHKWGAYIGNMEPTCEYLFDEPIIEKVYVYTVYKLVEKSKS
jgi:hypothetical protein